MKPEVLVTRAIQERPLALLSQMAQVTVHRGDRPMAEEEMLLALPRKKGLFSMAENSISARILEAGRDLKIVANYGVGYDNIDLQAATRLKIAVTNTPDVLTDTTADLTFTLILGIARRIAECDRFVREGNWVHTRSIHLMGTDVHGSTLGIVGLGRIGSAVARRAMGFNTQTLYTDIRPIDPAVENRVRVRRVSLEELLRASDFVTLHVPLTAQTTHLIGREQLSLMRKSAFLINASRGRVVDEEALVEALKNKTIAGAALDVFEREPQVSPELLAMANVLMTPHMGSATFKTREEMAFSAVRNIMAAIRGEVPPNILNPEIYKS